MINRSLKLLEQAHGVDSFITIRISGSVSTNDRMTLREIARQLCTDDAGIDDDGSSFVRSPFCVSSSGEAYATLQTSHAVILQSLLTLLEPQSSTASSSSATLDRSKPLIFILDDFDRFAERDERQSFLYCLLDIVQSKRRKGGMAVVGVSTRVVRFNSSGSKACFQTTHRTALTVSRSVSGLAVSLAFFASCRRSTSQPGIRSSAPSSLALRRIARWSPKHGIEASKISSPMSML